MNPRIVGLGLAQPDQRLTQQALYEHSPWGRTALLDKLFLDGPVHSRALVVPPSWWARKRTLTESNEAWRVGAEALGAAALRDALRGRSAESIDLIAVTTVTGSATPGVDVLLAKSVGLRGSVARIHFNNVGCHAAIPLLRVAADHVRARPEQLAATVAVEVCSACFVADDDPENLVALSLFGDGAAATLVAMNGTGPELIDFETRSDFAASETLGFALTDAGFRIRLHSSVPTLVGAQLPVAVDRLLGRNGLSRADVNRWCIHPGGSRVLDVARDSLGLPEPAVTASRRVLRNYGNMSSPTVLFVLAESVEERAPKAGDVGVLAAFGPGLGIEVALIRW